MKLFLWLANNNRNMSNSYVGDREENFLLDFVK